MKFLSFSIFYPTIFDRIYTMIYSHHHSLYVEPVITEWECRTCISKSSLSKQLFVSRHSTRFEQLAKGFTLQLRILRIYESKLENRLESIVCIVAGIITYSKWMEERRCDYSTAALSIAAGSRALALSLHRKSASWPHRCP